MVADEALLAKLLKGALAQLVERLLCKQDVIGSNPLGSTGPTGSFAYRARIRNCKFSMNAAGRRRG